MFTSMNQIADTPHDPECRITCRAWFNPFHGETLAFIERAGAVVCYEVFDIQLFGLRGQPLGERVK